MSLRIRTIARLTGIREATLRAWERRHGFPRPQRSENNNYRSYSREEVEKIRQVAQLIASGLSVGEAIAQVKDTPAPVREGGERFSERFWSAVMVLDGDSARRVLDEAQASMEVEAYCDTLLMPLLRDMSQRLDIAREHLGSALIRQRLRALLDAEGPQTTGPGVLLACPARDYHEGGLLALGLHLRRRGWQVTMLGADTPAEALQSACAQLRPAMVALSFVRSREPEELVALLSEVVPACAPAWVVVGGPGAREHLRTVFSLGARYAESAGELIALWQQGREIQHRTRAPVNG